MPDRTPVLFVFSTTSYQANGGLRSLFHIVRRLRAVRPILISQAPFAEAEELRASGAEVHISPDLGMSGGTLVERVRRAGSVARINPKIYRLIRERGIRVVHINDRPAFYRAAGGARLAGAQIVFNVRDVSGLRRARGVHKARWRVYRSLSHCTLGLSREMQSVIDREMTFPPMLQRTLLRRGPLRAFNGWSDFIYSAVDLDRMRPPGNERKGQLRARHGIREHEFAVGYIGAFNERKGQLRLLQALSRSPLPSNIHFYLLGDFRPDTDSYSRACQDLVRSAGLEKRVRIVGFDPDIDRWHQALDLGLVVSRDEGLARCMIESIACGTPVVSFDVCSAREILEDYDCGRVIMQGDYDALLREVHQLSADPATLNALAARGRRVAEELFLPERVVAAYEALYLGLASKSGSTAAPTALS